jgi:predicted CoA-binding protein
VPELVKDFLAQKRIAVAGVSRNPGAHGGNPVYVRLRQRGYQVFAVNPNADTVEGDRSYPDLRSIPGGVDGMVIATAPARAESIARQCQELGIRRVWMHHGPGQTSASPAAVDYCRQNGIAVIPGGCPLMFEPTSDGFHRCIRWVFERTGTVPTEI